MFVLDVCEQRKKSKAERAGTCTHTQEKLNNRTFLLAAILRGPSERGARVATTTAAIETATQFIERKMLNSARALCECWTKKENAKDACDFYARLVQKGSNSQTVGPCVCARTGICGEAAFCAASVKNERPNQGKSERAEQGIFGQAKGTISLADEWEWDQMRAREIVDHSVRSWPRWSESGRHRI